MNSSPAIPSNGRPADLEFDHGILKNEWLLTNGLGGFAMGTASGINARRYHGLLIAALNPPVNRVLVLHSLIIELTVGETTTSLSTQLFGEHDLPHPDGISRRDTCTPALPDRLVQRYRLNRDGSAQLCFTLALTPWQNEVRMQFSATGLTDPAKLRIRPLTPLRDFHGLDREDHELLRAERVRDHELLVRRGDISLSLAGSHMRAEHDAQWWRDFSYPLDRERGQSWREDVFSPGVFVGELSPGQEPTEPLELIAAIREPSVKPDSAERKSTAPLESDDPLDARLRIAADQFIVRRHIDGPDASPSPGRTWAATVIAGYPWFADWGRDAMIALPGLMLLTGRTDEALQTLATYAAHLHNGLIPNRFDDYAGSAHYNTVDAGLWFIHAVGRTELIAGLGRGREMLIDACRKIIRAYRNGTDGPIVMDSADALIRAGDEHTQLTWMDAQRDGVTFTPRHGKAIEINALWHHALHTLSRLTNDPAERAELSELANTAGESIRTQFWSDEAGCCHDLLIETDAGWRGDQTVRPNQIFAVCLAPSPLAQDQQAAVVTKVRDRLLTPYGLRTLDPEDPAYRGRFEGDLFQRDATYHQGTVWPWLIGPYISALMAVKGPAARSEAEAVIAPLLQSLETECFGQVAEVYDGDSPHRAGGCPAQAWSVAAVLEARAAIAAGAHPANFPQFNAGIHAIG